METQRLVELLQGSLVPDTEKVQRATQELQSNYYSKPECIPALIEIATTHSESSIRQQAAVVTARQTYEHWLALDDKVDKEAIRKHLLNATLHEQVKIVRHSLSRVIAAIASIDLAKKQWPALLPGLVQGCTSDAVASREICSYILYAILEHDPSQSSNDFHGLLSLTNTMLRDKESGDVRVNALQIISGALEMFDPDQDPKALAAVHELIPLMVEVLQGAIGSQDEEKIKTSFECIQSLLVFETPIVSKHLSDLILFMVGIAANGDMTADVRCQALAFLSQAIYYRRMKVQGIRNVGGQRDMGSLLTIRAMQIVTELDDEEEDDDDDESPARSALELIDELSTALPPKQVVVPLLEELQKYSKSENPRVRRAGLLCLANCVEGAPDFVSTQLSMLMPIILALLRDSDMMVRSAALGALAEIAQEMSSELESYHKDLINLIVQNLEFAKTNTTLPTPNSAEKKNASMIRLVCAALEAVAEGIPENDMRAYAPQLMTQVAPLIKHSNPEIQTAAAGSIGAIAETIGSEFSKYAEEVIPVLATFLWIKDSDEQLFLRSGVCDTLGRIATAVGPDMFKPCLNNVMLSSEEGLNLGNPRLKESSFILWGSLSKVYGVQFVQYLPGVMNGLFQCLESEDEGPTISVPVLENSEFANTEKTITNGNESLKIKAVPAADADMDDDNESDIDIDFTPITDEALAKEVALDVLADVVTHACDADNVAAILEKVVQTTTALATHSYTGVRKSAISCLYRCYSRVCQLTEQATGRKWDSNPPLEPTDPIIKFGKIVRDTTKEIWDSELERAVVTEINRSLTEVLKTFGPFLIQDKSFMEVIRTVIRSLLLRTHTCQVDYNDTEEQEVVDSDKSEYDWLVIDTALDVLTSLAYVLKGSAIELWKEFEKHIFKLVASDVATERSVAVGVVAEMTGYIGSEITPYTDKILKNILRRLSDPDPETRSNAAYATGQLMYHSKAASCVENYPTILQKLESMLPVTESRERDNAAGCLCRMIMAHPDRVPLPDVLPALVRLLPLKDDYLENEPVYQCIYTLYEKAEPTIQGLTPSILPILEQVLAPPEDQLKDDTRQLVKRLIVELYKSNQGVFASHPNLVQLARGL